jgi:hypothetical protein
MALRENSTNLWFPDEGRMTHISLVLREIWDTTNVNRWMDRMNREMWGTRPSPGNEGSLRYRSLNLSMDAGCYTAT